MKKNFFVGIVLITFLLLCVGMKSAENTHPAAAPAPEKMARPHSAAPNVIIRMRHIAIPRVVAVSHVKNFIHNKQNFTQPDRDGTGALIPQKEMKTPPQHGVVMHNRALLTQISNQKQNETDQNHFYWHNFNKMKYAHYRDDSYTDWYGFYQGPTFYWTQQYNDRWWWYDSNYLRWVFWAEGFWWWPDPSGTLYVYTDNNYYPYEDEFNGVTVKQPEIMQPPADVPSIDAGTGYASPDGRRQVQVYGAQDEAYLWDTTGEEPVFIKFLGANVKNVQFSKQSSGKPQQILVNFNDSSFALFDADGNPLDPPVPPSQSDELLSPPAIMPPVPAVQSTD